jgi:type IV secretory pathway ATPase VirB11/archaellum biosynthesis ATPase
MIYEEHEVLLVDCKKCPFHNQILPSSISLSETCKKCPQIKGEYDRLRVKTRLFTKEYDNKGNLLSIEPFFVDVRFRKVAKNVELKESYTISTGALVSIYEKTDGVGYLYFITIPEMNISFQQIKELYYKAEEFKKTGKSDDAIIRRWYHQYGILEHLLFDEKILEININPPAYKTAIRVIHADYDECVTNIFSSKESLNYLALRLKLSTGRPFNRGQPQLDGEIHIDNQKARVAAIISPFSIYGYAYSIRKHRENPWTLVLFMKKGTINHWFAGFMSFLISQGRAFLVAGPRGSGKTALLGASLLELLPKYRMITIEDTQELPIDAYKSLGYDILPMKVRSALADDSMELSADKGVRTSLRLGDSCLILGEIRSTEAKVLYEAMRVGAMSNVVCGTIHGDSPYGVYDRVVNDLGVPPGSFKVTDVIIIVNQIKLPGGMKRVRRVLQVTEVLKHWDKEPEFLDILVYNPKTDELEPTKEFLGGKSTLINTILGISQGYKNYNDVIEEIRLRGWSKLVHSLSVDEQKYLEAKYVSPVNVLFTKLYEKLLPLESPHNMALFQDAFKKNIAEVITVNEKINTIAELKRMHKGNVPVTKPTTMPTQLESPVIIPAARKDVFRDLRNLIKQKAKREMHEVEEEIKEESESSEKKFYSDLRNKKDNYDDNKSDDEIDDVTKGEIILDTEEPTDWISRVRSDLSFGKNKVR